MMQQVIIDQPDFDYQAIESLLRSAAPLISPFARKHFDPYSMGHYLKQEDRHKARIIYLLDLNVLVPIVDLIRGERASDKRHRVAAAIFAMANFIDIQIAPDGAIHEARASVGEKETRERLHCIYRAIDTEPKALADVALGITDYLDPRAVKTIPSFKKKIPKKALYYDINLPPALKVAAIAREAGEANNLCADHLIEFLQWSFDEFIFTAPSIAYASLFLCPKRKGKMFKGLRKRDARVAVKGAMNAARDMAIVQRWLDAIKLSNFSFLCTFDNALAACASELVRVTKDESEPSRLYMNRLRKEWGDSEALRVKTLHDDFEGRRSDPSRRCNGPKGNWESYCDSLPRLLESELRSS